MEEEKGKGGNRVMKRVGEAEKVKGQPVWEIQKSFRVVRYDR